MKTVFNWTLNICLPMMMMTMNYFRGMISQQKMFSLIFPAGTIATLLLKIANLQHTTSMI